VLFVAPKGLVVKKGLLIVLSSPSGGGKTTIAHRLLARDKNIVRSVSCTTRKPRVGEKDGRDYFFLTPSRFRAMVSRQAFLEWARVHHNSYGTPKAWVLSQVHQGKDVLMVIDVQGGKAVKRRYPDALLIFLKPPSFKILKQRLQGRKSDSHEALKVRLKDARWEMKEGRHYDFQVTNDVLSKAVRQVRAIIRAKRSGIKTV